jgi:hypothetical protein
MTTIIRRLNLQITSIDSTVTKFKGVIDMTHFTVMNHNKMMEIDYFDYMRRSRWTFGAGIEETMALRLFPECPLELPHTVAMQETETE